MPRLIWSPSALRDVERLNDFLKQKNRDAASRAIHAIRLGVRVLAAHPEIGRTVEDLPPEFRDWFIEFGDGGYVVRYRHDGNDALILAVRHAKEAGI